MRSLNTVIERVSDVSRVQLTCCSYYFVVHLAPLMMCSYKRAV